MKSQPPSRPSGAAHLSSRQVAVFSLVPALVFLFVLEVGARVFEMNHPPDPVDYGLGFTPESRAFVPSSVLPGGMETSPRKLAAFQPQRFSPSHGPETFRIVALGESSVFLLQDELLSLSARLQQRVKGRFREVQVLNAGANAYGSQRLVIVSAEMLNYQPDLLMLYLGHNEFEELEQLEIAHVETLPLQILASRIASVRVLTAWLTNVRVGKLRSEQSQRILATSIPDVKGAWAHSFTTDEINARMEAFAQNVREIVRMYGAAGIPVVMGSIPSNLVHPYIPTDQMDTYAPVARLYEARKFEEALPLARAALAQIRGRHQASTMENDILRQIASDEGLPFAEVERAVAAAEPHGVPGETLFDDHCHLNAEGMRLLIQAYEPLIEALLVEEAGGLDGGPWER